MQAQTDFDLGLWVAGLGPRLDAAQVLEWGGATWLLLFDNDFTVAIEHDAPRALLVLTAALGSIDPSVEAKAHKLLLEVSSLWRHTGGVRMAIDPDDGMAVQLCDFALAGLNLDALEDSVRNFVSLARTARDSLGRLGVQAPVQAVRPFEFIRA